jgi:DNA-3-methyladenine glycosylase II
MAMYKHYLDKVRKNGLGNSPQKKARKRKIILPKPEQMEKIAKSWEPYRSIACWYLWKSLDVKTIG